jgi:hypothetical protein
VGKYDPLREYLVSQIGQGDELAMSFAEIEGLVGRLPASAGAQRAWWETTNAAKAEAHAWLSAGWRVQSVDLRAKQVVFSRDNSVTGAGNTMMSPPPGATRVDGPSISEAAGLSSAKSIAENGESSNSAHHPSRVGDLVIVLGAATATGASFR